jgi:hypothetical protein
MHSDFKTGESSILNAYPQTYSLKSYFCCNILLIHAMADTYFCCNILLIHAMADT